MDSRPPATYALSTWGLKMGVNSEVLKFQLQKRRWICIDYALTKMRQVFFSFMNFRLNGHNHVRCRLILFSCQTSIKNPPFYPLRDLKTSQNSEPSPVYERHLGHHGQVLTKMGSRNGTMIIFIFILNFILCY